VHQVGFIYKILHKALILDSTLYTRTIILTYLKLLKGKQFRTYNGRLSAETTDYIT